MNESIVEWHSQIANINNLVDQITNHFGESPVSSKIFNALENYKRFINNFKKSNDIESKSRNAIYIANSASVIGGLIKEIKDEKLQTIGNELGKRSRTLITSVENNPLTHKPLNQIENKEHVTHNQKEQESLRELRKIELEIERLKNKLKDTEKPIEEKIKQTTFLYNKGLSDIQSKKEEINQLLGHASKRILAGGFEENAAREKKTADWLRYTSIALMLLIVLLAGYSFVALTYTSDFNWGNFASRMFLSIVLSIPAVYLARESSKHRAQQYLHQQTALDLKVIDPYIATLPIENQHAMKATIADRLFAARDTNAAAPDSGLVTHDMAKLLLEKLDHITAQLERTTTQRNT